MMLISAAAIAVEEVIQDTTSADKAINTTGGRRSRECAGRTSHAHTKDRRQRLTLTIESALEVSRRRCNAGAGAAETYARHYDITGSGTTV